MDSSIDIYRNSIENYSIDVHFMTQNSPFGSPLGTNTKSRANRLHSGLQNIEQVNLCRVLSRAQKFILQEIARKILKQMQIRTTKNHPEGYKTFVHRVNYCLRCRIDSKKGVGVRINEERGTAHYDNLQRCGSVWTCAPCSGEITEVRKIELKQGIDNWRKKSGHWRRWASHFWHYGVKK